MVNESDTHRQTGFNHVNPQSAAKPTARVIGDQKTVVDIEGNDAFTRT